VYIVEGRKIRNLLELGPIFRLAGLLTKRGFAVADDAVNSYCMIAERA
jgi:hypothetical protein